MVVTSDNRIKDIIGISDSKKDLSSLLSLEVTDYKMKDDKECLDTIRDLVDKFGHFEKAGFELPELMGKRYLEKKRKKEEKRKALLERRAKRKAARALGVDIGTIVRKTRRDGSE